MTEKQENSRRIIQQDRLRDGGAEGGGRRELWSKKKRWVERKMIWARHDRIWRREGERKWVERLC